MSEQYNNNCKRISAIIKTRPWLFRKGAPNFGIGEYIAHFEHLTKKEFFILPLMMPYKVDILDEYKDCIFNTFFLPQQAGSLSMNTCIQITPSKHVFLLWGNSEDFQDTVFYGTMYSDNTDDYRSFLLDHERFIYDEAKINGFGIRQRT